MVGKSTGKSAGKSAGKTSWVITTRSPGALPAVAQAVRSVGGQVQSQLDELGVLVAQGSAAQARAWGKLAGVADVAADSSVDIGPPGADPA